MHNESIFLAINWALLGINVFVALLSFIDRDKIRFKYLLVLFMANLISVLDNIYELSFWWLIHPEFYNVYLPFTYLLAPTMYLYIRCLVYPPRQQSFTWKSPHWLGFIITLMLCLPYFMLDTEIKLSRLTDQSGTLEHLGIITMGPFAMLLLIIPFSVVYFVLSLKLVTKNTLQITAFFSNLENKDLSWVRWIFIVFMLALIFGSLQLFMPDAFTETNLWRLISSAFDFIWLTIFGALTLKQKPIRINSNPYDSQATQSKTVQKYQKSPLSQQQIDDIKSQLHYAMKESKLYRRPGFNLRDLAEELNVSQNKISQVLNNELNTGFYLFINEWRIKEACIRIKEQSHSILDIAFEVGFNSKSTFNAAFKKLKKMTPSQYKKQHDTSA